MSTSGFSSSSSSSSMSSTPVKGFLIDMTGVLYNGEAGGDGIAIEKSAEAVEMVYKHSTVKFLSNSKGRSNEQVAERLKRLGITVHVDDIITPAPLVAEYLRENNLRPHLLVRDKLMPYFNGIPTENPNCVVVGEVEHGYTFERLNNATRVLLGMEEKLMITMGNGKYFKRPDGISIDVGFFAAGFKHSTGCNHINIGKPSPAYFEQGLKALGMTAAEVVMIGDDTISDVKGAQDVGMRAVQVRTGKWTPECEKLDVIPDLTTDCLYDAIKHIFANDFNL